MAGQIVINGVLGKTVRVFDIMGREVAERQRAERDVFSIDIPVSGVYVVKIGDLYSQKVVMVK